MVHQHPSPKSSNNHSRRGINNHYIRLVLYVSIAVIVFFLIAEHAAHLAGLLPYSLLFLCLFMHLFMHGGHGGHGGSDDRDRSN